MTPPSRLNLLVLRSAKPEATLAFYQSLGLTFQCERHGDGPLHHAAESDGFVFEIYPATEDRITRDVRLGFRVESLEDALDRVEAAGGTIVSCPTYTEWGLRAVIRDPDGRPVELMQSTSS